MSRRPTTHAMRTLKERTGWQVADIAGACGAKPCSLYRYCTRQHALPRLEATLAAFLNLSVPALRRLLFATATPEEANASKDPTRKSSANGSPDNGTNVPRRARRSPDSKTVAGLRADPDAQPRLPRRAPGKRRRPPGHSPHTTLTNQPGQPRQQRQPESKT